MTKSNYAGPKSVKIPGVWPMMRREEHDDQIPVEIPGMTTPMNYAGLDNQISLTVSRSNPTGVQQLYGGARSVRSPHYSQGR